MGPLTLFKDHEYFIGLTGIGVGMALLVCGLYFAVVKPLQRRRQYQQRVRGIKGEAYQVNQVFKADQELSKGLVSKIVEKIAGWGKIENIQTLLNQADVNLAIDSFLSIVGILVCTGYIIGTLKDNFFLSLGLAVVLGSAPFVFLNMKRRRKAKLIEKQMPEGMELLARSLRAGHTLPSAMNLISGEINDPLGKEMKIVYEEQRLGLGLAKALRRMGQRVASRDVWYFITAVLIQSESGGNLAEIMENIGQIVRNRLNLKGKVKALTSEGRFSAAILLLLPVVVFFLLFFINRTYIMILLNDPLGFKILAAGIISMGMGALWMKRMIRIKV
jgi:tight adherence protein B